MLNQLVRRHPAVILVLALFALLTLPTSSVAQTFDRFGLTDVRDVTAEEQEARGLIVGYGALVLSVAPDSPASDAGFEEGDVIVSADGALIQTADGLRDALETVAPGESLPVVGFRGPSALTATLAAPIVIAQPPAADVGVRPLASDPLLMIDSGGHQAKVQDVLFSDDGEWLVSAADDKTVRVWDWKNGRTVRVIRMATEDGQAGAIYALALSPDGRTAAVGGLLGGPVREDWTAVRLINLETGRIERVMRGHFNVILDMDFSPDGARLLSTDFDGVGFIWDVETGDPVHRLDGHVGEIYGAEFTGDGERVALASFDQTVSLWDVQTGQMIRSMTGHTEKVRSLSITNDGVIVTGSVFGEIRLWDAETGDFLRTLTKQNYEVGALAVSPGGDAVLSTSGTYGSGSDHQSIFDLETGAAIATFTPHRNTVLAAGWGPNGLVATGGGTDNEIQIWDPTSGEIVQTLKGVGRTIWSAGVSDDRGRVGWGNVWETSSALGRNPIQYTMNLPQSALDLLESPRDADPEEVNALGRAILSMNFDGKLIELSHAPGGNYNYQNATLIVSEDGQVRTQLTLGSTDGYRHNAYSLTPDGTRILTAGNNGFLTMYDLDGGYIGEYSGHRSDVWAVSPSADGALVVSASHDQTVRIWNLETFELVLTIFPGLDGSWIAWTPQGYYTYDSGPNPLVNPPDRIGWLLNYGVDETPDFITAEQIGPLLNRPRLVARAIQLASAQEAIREFNERRGEPIRVGPITIAVDPLPASLDALFTALPPLLRVVDVQPDADGKALVTTVMRLNGLPLDALEVTVDGRSVDTEEVDLPASPALLRAADLGEGEILARYRIPVARGGNRLAVTARTDAGRSLTDRLSFTYGAEGMLDRLGRLRILAIGVDDYSGAFDYQSLRFAAKDASEFVAATRRVMGPQYAGVDTKLLINGGGDGEPTRDAILEGMKWLAEAEAGDTSILFLAGHGRGEGDEYFLLPTDYSQPQGVSFGERALPWSLFRESLENVKGRKLLFLDACRSDTAFHATLTADARRADTIAFSSTSQGQRAIESEEVEHGLFTYAVIDSLNGSGFVDGELWSSDLGVNVGRLVRRLSRGAQEPIFTTDIGSVLLARGS